MVRDDGIVPLSLPNTAVPYPPTANESSTSNTHEGSGMGAYCPNRAHTACRAGSTERRSADRQTCSDRRAASLGLPQRDARFGAAPQDVPRAFLVHSRGPPDAPCVGLGENRHADPGESVHDPVA
jgi:hypothetical protein